MELSFAQQTAAFGWSILLGIGLALFYGVLKFLRVLFAFGKAAVIVVDVIFMLVWALAAFYFSLAFLSGYIRLYVFFGSFIGFAAYRLFPGRLLGRIYCTLIGALKAIFHKICIKVKLFAKYLLKIAGKLLYNKNSKAS